MRKVGLPTFHLAHLSLSISVKYVPLIFFDSSIVGLVTSKKYLKLFLTKNILNKVNAYK